jgi:hypothetical protein
MVASTSNGIRAKSPVHPAFQTAKTSSPLLLHPLGCRNGSGRLRHRELNGKSGISPEMALRLSIAFATTPESWLNQQMQYDLAKARRKTKKLKVARIAA